MINHAISFFLLVILLLAVTNTNTTNTSVSNPSWMHVGAFAAYDFSCAGVICTNNTLVTLGNHTEAALRWQCLDVKDSFSKLEISLILRGENKTLTFMSIAFVNMTDREVYLTNHTLVGTTHFWAPINQAKVTLWEKYPDRIIATQQIGSWSNTPQGPQKIFILSGHGTIDNKSINIDNFYDTDTGVMTDSTLQYEGSLYAINLSIILVNGRLKFTDTNINLGPSEIWPELANYLPIAIFALGFFGVSLVIYRRRNGRKRNRKRRRW